MNFIRALLIFLAILLKRKCILCFNLQTKLPLILKPIVNEIDLDHPINFGVSLTSLITNSNNEKKINKTILLVGAPAADLGDSNERPGIFVFFLLFTNLLLKIN